MQLCASGVQDAPIKGQDKCIWSKPTRPRMADHSVDRSTFAFDATQYAVHTVSLPRQSCC